MANMNELIASKLNQRKRSPPIRIQKRIGNEMVSVRPRCSSKLPIAVIARSAHETNVDIISEIESCLEAEGQEIVDLTIELDNFTSTERQYISRIIANNCIVLEHLRYKSVMPLPRLERMDVPILNQVRSLEFLLDNDTNVAYDAFILSHLRVVANQLETLSFGTIDIGRCLRNTICRPLRHLQVPLNEDTYNFLEYHSKLEGLKIFGSYCDLERLQPYMPIIKNLCINCNIITNVRAITKLRNLTNLEIYCTRPNETYNEVISALKSGNMLESVIDFKIREKV